MLEWWNDPVEMVEPMPSLHITNQETVALARRLAERTGESLTTAVTEALRERLERIDDLTPEERRRQILAIAAEWRRHRTDTRTREEIDDDMYDEWGLPK